MKKYQLILLLALTIVSCKKDTVIITGQSYHIRSNVFNKGVYQPAQPVEVNTLYTDPNTGLPYANVTDINGTVWYIPVADLK